jgi:hypothetical protein
VGDAGLLSRERKARLKELTLGRGRYTRLGLLHHSQVGIFGFQSLEDLTGFPKPVRSGCEVLGLAMNVSQ